MLTVMKITKILTRCSNNHIEGVNLTEGLLFLMDDSSNGSSVPTIQKLRRIPVKSK